MSLSVTLWREHHRMVPSCKQKQSSLKSKDNGNMIRLTPSAVLRHGLSHEILKHMRRRSWGMLSEKAKHLFNQTLCLDCRHLLRISELFHVSFLNWSWLVWSLRVLTNNTEVISYPICRTDEEQGYVDRTSHVVCVSKMSVLYQHYHRQLVSVGISSVISRSVTVNIFHLLILCDKNKSNSSSKATEIYPSFKCAYFWYPNPGFKVIPPTIFIFLTASATLSWLPAKAITV